MVTSYLPQELPLLEGLETGPGIQSLGLHVSTEHSGRYRASVESILVFNCMNQLNSLLQKENLQGKSQQIEILSYRYENSYPFYVNHTFGLSSVIVNKFFSVKGQRVLISDLWASLSVSDSPLWRCGTRTAIDNTKISDCDCLSITYLEKHAPQKHFLSAKLKMCDEDIFKCVLIQCECFLNYKIHRFEVHWEKYFCREWGKL